MKLMAGMWHRRKTTLSPTRGMSMKPEWEGNTLRKYLLTEKENEMKEE